MVNQISTSPGNITSGAANAARKELAKREAQAEQKFSKPARQEENYLPANETIATLVRNALAALKQGTIFDRGSIVNLVV